MFRYTPGLSWTDGVFLRPHHFQQVQQESAAARNSDRCLSLPYAYGLHTVEIDETALENQCLSVTRLRAILPGGAEVDLPGNAAAAPLDLTAAVASGEQKITVYMGVQPLREGEANLGEAPAMRYAPVPKSCADLNAGGQEHDVMFRRLRVQFSCKAEELAGYEKMPLLRLVCTRSRDGRPSLRPDRDFLPPCLTLSAAPELSTRLQALTQHLEHIITNIRTALCTRDMQTAESAPRRLEKTAKAAAIQGALAVLRQLMALPACPPVALYTELCRLMMQLAAYCPQETYDFPETYCHDDAMPQFAAVIEALYRLTSSEATEWCVRVELHYDEQRQAWLGDLQPDWIPAVHAVYVGVQSTLQQRRMADHVEEGDAFKLTAGSRANSRVRGVRLAEDRMPSPLLPAVEGCTWFRADALERDFSWQDITAESKCALAWSPQILPNTTAELYLILSTPEQRS